MGICIRRYGLAIYLGQTLIDVRWGLVHLRCPALGAVQWLAGHGWVIDGPVAVAAEKHSLGDWT